jgi:hypothetical protein
MRLRTNMGKEARLQWLPGTLTIERSEFSSRLLKNPLLGAKMGVYKVTRKTEL